MLSESARAASAAEARFRIQAPNSRPRATTIVALDESSEAVARGLSGVPWSQAAFFKAPSAPPDGDPSIFSLDGQRRGLGEAIAGADQVILLAAAGGDADGAELVGRACSDRRVMTTALIVGADRVPERELSKTLAELRPWSLMVVIAGNDDYIADMFTALRV